MGPHQEQKLLMGLKWKNGKWKTFGLNGVWGNKNSSPGSHVGDNTALKIV